MRLYEEKLKKIIEKIEEYAVVNKIEILNNEIIISVFGNPNIVRSFDLNKPLQFSITFTLGEKKEKI